MADPFSLGTSRIGDMVTVVQRKLERFEVRSRHGIDRSVAFHGLKFDVIDRMSGEMFADLSAYVWSEVIQDEAISFKFETPSDWWQHFKERWFPKWALRHWPVVMRMHAQTHQFRTTALFPEFKYEAPPGCGQYVIRTSIERRA